MNLNMMPIAMGFVCLDIKEIMEFIVLKNSKKIGLSLTVKCPFFSHRRGFETGAV